MWSVQSASYVVQPSDACFDATLWDWKQRDNIIASFVVQPSNASFKAVQISSLSQESMLNLYFSHRFSFITPLLIFTFPFIVQPLSSFISLTLYCPLLLSHPLRSSLFPHARDYSSRVLLCFAFSPSVLLFAPYFFYLQCIPLTLSISLYVSLYYSLILSH